MSNKKWKMSQNLWPSQNILTLSLIHVYALIVFFFLFKKLRFSFILQDFLFGIGIGIRIRIGIWAVKNFRSSHHGSVVHSIPEGTLGVQRSKKNQGTEVCSLYCKYFQWLLFHSCHFSFLGFGHFWRQSYKNTKILCNQ